MLSRGGEGEGVEREWGRVGEFFSFRADEDREAGKARSGEGVPEALTGRLTQTPREEGLPFPSARRGILCG